MNWQIVGALQTGFIDTVWDPARAAQADRAPSLSRTFLRLRDMVVRASSGQR